MGRRVSGDTSVRRKLGGAGNEEDDGWEGSCVVGVLVKRVMESTVLAAVLLVLVDIIKQFAPIISS